MDKRRKEAEVWEVRDRVMLSMKDLMFKERPMKKLVDQFINPYVIEEVVFLNVIKLQLLILIKIYPVVNIN